MMDSIKRKPFLIGIAVLFLALQIIAPFRIAKNAVAADPKTPVNDPSCWSSEACILADGVPGKVGDGGCGAWTRCYPLEKPIKTAVRIPGGEITNIGDYIAVIFNYLISIAGIAAAIMIMIGGLQWLTAGGSPDKIGKAKTTISNAAIGLVLALGSYLMLQTVNPDVLKLKLPRVYMIRPVAYTAVKCGDGKGTPGSPCESDADCRPDLKCQEIKQTGVTKLAYAVALGSVAVLGVGVAGPITVWELVKQTGWWGARTVKAGAQYLFSWKGMAGALKFVWKNKTTLAVSSAVGYAGYKNIEFSTDDCPPEIETWVGMCYKEADHDVPSGGLCREDKHCKEGLKCIPTSNIGGYDIGICSGGKENSACESHSNCERGLICVETQLRLKFCSNGLTGSPCGVDADCQGEKSKCVDNACVPEEGMGSEGTRCVTDLYRNPGECEDPPNATYGRQCCQDELVCSIWQGTPRPKDVKTCIPANSIPENYPCDEDFECQTGACLNRSCE